MLIKRQFHLAFAAVLLALTAASSAILFMHVRLQRIERVRGWANEVAATALDCNVLGSETIMQDNTRAREQYRVLANRLDALLAEPPTLPGVASMALEIRAGRSRLDALLRDLEVKTRLPGAAPRDDYELQTMLVSQWMLQTRAFLDSAQQMRQRAVVEAARLRTVNLWVDIVAMTIVALVTGWVFWRSYRTLVTPLEQLSEGARRVGAGDLDHRIPTPHRNEIGIVAESFNRMTQQLGAREAEVNEKLRDLEAFCYSVAHDLKAPLRSVVGFGGLLEGEFKDKLGDEGCSYIERMRSGSLRMSALIDDLLQFGQLTHRRVETTALSLQSLCEGLVAEMQPEVSAANGSIQCGALKYSVEANAVLLKQAMANLINNALKFTRPGVPPIIQLRARPESQWVIIEVEDNGIGIAEEFHGKVFALFHRLHDHHEYPGTGIGLAIVQKSIQRLGGRVGLRSKPGEGTAFWIQLRAAKE